MGKADLEFNRVVEKILNSGYSDKGMNVRGKYETDGKPAHTLSVIGESMRFDNKEVPILTTKWVAWKTAIRELLWIWQKKSNVVQDLRDEGVNIWNQWEQEDGTIGKAYGYQLGKKNRTIMTSQSIPYFDHNLDITSTTVEAKLVADQVDYLIHQLRNNPASKRHITMLWNPDELDEMSLTPCVYETQWHVKGNRLHLEVRCRSNDMALGNPFNIFQYNVLQRMIAQVLGYELGEYIYHIGDAHVYERHIEDIQEQISRETYNAPKLFINPNVKNFYDFTIDDFKLLNYEYGEKIKYEVVV